MPPSSVLITGASGFAGRHFLPILEEAAPGLRLIPASRRAGVEVGGRQAIQFDLGNPEAVRSTLAQFAPDMIFHLAGEAATNPAARDLGATWRSNFHEPVELAKIVRDEFPQIRFVFVSSGAIYGRSALSHAALDETAPVDPIGLYAETKAEADQVLGEMVPQGLKLVRLRPFNHIGPGQWSPDFVVPKLARQVALIGAGRQEPEIRINSLESERDFLDVRDVCVAYAQVVRLADHLEPGIILNIASGQARSIGSILEALTTRASIMPRVIAEGAPAEIKTVRGDASKARGMLDWQPKIPFDQTLGDTLAWWQDKITSEAA